MSDPWVILKLELVGGPEDGAIKNIISQTSSKSAALNKFKKNVQEAVVLDWARGTLEIEEDGAVTFGYDDIKNPRAREFAEEFSSAILDEETDTVYLK